MSGKTATIYFDGGSRPTNPGPAAGAAVVTYQGGDEELTKYIGEGTNNEAEYAGLSIALEYCLDNGITEVEIFGDSKLVVDQINRDNACRSERLKPWLEWVRWQLSQFEKWSIRHTYREGNSRADALATSCILSQNPLNPFMSSARKRP